MRYLSCSEDRGCLVDPSPTIKTLHDPNDDKVNDTWLRNHGFSSVLSFVTRCHKKGAWGLNWFADKFCLNTPPSILHCVLDVSSHQHFKDQELSHLGKKNLFPAFLETSGDLAPGGHNPHMTKGRRRCKRFSTDLAVSSRAQRVTLLFYASFLHIPYALRVFIFHFWGEKCVEVLLRLGQYKQFSSQFRVSVHPIGTRNYLDSFLFRTFTGPMNYRSDILLLLSNLNNIREPLLGDLGETCSFVEQLQFLGNFSLNWPPYKTCHPLVLPPVQSLGALFTWQLIKYLGAALLSPLSLQHLTFLTKSCLCPPQGDVPGFEVCNMVSDVDLYQEGGRMPEVLLFLYYYILRTWTFWQWKIILLAQRTRFPEAFMQEDALVGKTMSPLWAT